MMEKKEDASTKAPPTSDDGKNKAKGTSTSDDTSSAAGTGVPPANGMSKGEPSQTPQSGAALTGSSNDNSHEHPGLVTKMATISQSHNVAPAASVVETDMRAEKNDSGEGSSSTTTTGKSGTDQSSNSLSRMTPTGPSAATGTLSATASAQSTSLPTASLQAPAVSTTRPQAASGSLASSTTVTSSSSSNPNQSIQPPPAKRLKTESSQQAAPTTTATTTAATASVAQSQPQSATQSKTAPTLSSMMNYTLNKSTAQKIPASTAASHPQRQPPKQFSLFDMTPEITAMQKTIQQLLGLLHSYGPLTAGQLEYNLPVQGVSLGQERINFHDILQVLVALNLVQQQKPATQSSFDGTNTASSSTAPDEATLYCVNHGIPRLDTALLPQQVLDQISHAHIEISNSQKRVQRLTQLLAAQQQQQQHLYGSTRPHESTSNTTPPTPASVKHKDILRQIVMEFPEVLQDPVYVTALKNLHVDNVLAGGSDSTVPAVRPKRANAASASTAATSGTKPAPDAAPTTTAAKAKTIHASPQPPPTRAVSRVAAQAAAAASTLVAQQQQQQQQPPSQSSISAVAITPAGARGTIAQAATSISTTANSASTISSAPVTATTKAPPHPDNTGTK